jgi:hypothetical protein
LLTGLSAGALTGCDSSLNQRPRVSTEAVYTNNHYVPGVGYYHAPYRAFYPRPYNDFDPQIQRYYYGGQWALAPEQSITNISSPTASAAQTAEATRTDIQRGGWGSSSRSHSVWS